MDDSKKRHLDDSSDCHLMESRKHKTMVQEARDFPHGGGITEAEAKSVKNLKNVDSNLGKMSFHGKDKFVGSQHFKNNKGSSFKPKEFARNKPSFGSRPPQKVKFWDPRSAEVGHAQKLKVTTTVTRRTTLKNVGSNLGKMAAHGKDKLVEFQPLKNNKHISFKPKELERNKSYLGTRRNRKVKFWDPTCSMEEGDARKPNLDNVHSNPRKEQVKREKIKEAMIMFDEVNKKLYQDNKLKPRGERIADWRVPHEAVKIVKQKLKWKDPEKMLGPICGVQIGDKFKYRSQLQMIGLHYQLHSGIDYTKIGEKNLAISVVDSHRYLNESGFRDKMIYCGHGGFGFMGIKLPPQDQKLERGNLALRNSMNEKNPIRVIRRVQGVGNSGFYVYDGLYVVSHYVQKRSEEGKTVFKFQLDRVPGQPQLQNMVNGIVAGAR